MRRVAIRHPILGILADHLAAAIIGAHRDQMIVLCVRHADAGRAVTLVAREDIKIAIDVLHVDGQMDRSLTAIDQHRDAPRVRELHNIFYRR